MPPCLQWGGGHHRGTPAGIPTDTRVRTARRRSSRRERDRSTVASEKRELSSSTSSSQSAERYRMSERSGRPGNDGRRTALFRGSLLSKRAWDGDKSRQAPKTRQQISVSASGEGCTGTDPFRTAEFCPTISHILSIIAPKPRVLYYNFPCQGEIERNGRCDYITICAKIQLKIEKRDLCPAAKTRRPRRLPRASWMGWSFQLADAHQGGDAAVDMGLLQHGDHIPVCRLGEGVEVTEDLGQGLL